MRYERVQTDAASLDFGEGSDGDLAAAAEFVEQGALAGGGGACGRVIEEVPEASALPCRRCEFRFPGRLVRRPGSSLPRE